MSNNKQTAVEWLIESINERCVLDEIMIDKAKQMEKDNIVNAHIEGQPFHSVSSHKAEQYYKETYGK